VRLTPSRRARRLRTPALRAANVPAKPLPMLAAAIETENISPFITLGNGRSVCVWKKLCKKRTRFHAKNSDKIYDLLFSCGAAASRLSQNLQQQGTSNNSTQLKRPSTAGLPIVKLQLEPRHSLRVGK
jgi:hypothetical protein